VLKNHATADPLVAPPIITTSYDLCCGKALISEKGISSRGSVVVRRICQLFAQS
jgi:hypothetical protein